MAQGRNQQRWRLAAVTALSVLAHAGVFILIGLSIPGLREPLPIDTDPIDISLVAPDFRPRPARDLPPGQPRLGAPGRPTDSPPIRVTPLAPPADIPPSPLPAPAPGKTDSPPGANDVQRRAATGYPEGREEARRVLRGTYGCAYMDDVGLNRREREACYDRYGRGPARAVGPTIPAEKRARWDRAAAKQQADREWRENPTVPVGTDESQGPGRPAGLGPATPTVIRPF